MAIEIAGFPVKNGGSLHAYVNVYQRVTVFKICLLVASHSLGWVKRMFGLEPRATFPGVHHGFC